MPDRFLCPAQQPIRVSTETDINIHGLPTRPRAFGASTCRRRATTRSAASFWEEHFMERLGIAGRITSLFAFPPHLSLPHQEVAHTSAPSI